MKQLIKFNKNNGHKFIKVIYTFFEAVIKIEVKDNNVEQVLEF